MLGLSMPTHKTVMEFFWIIDNIVSNFMSYYKNHSAFVWKILCVWTILYVLAKANSCIKQTLVAKTEGTISGILTTQPLSYGDPICFIQMTNIPEYSVVEFTINSLTCIPQCEYCTDRCRCGSGLFLYHCHYINIGDSFTFHRFKSSSTTPKYLYSNAADIFIDVFYNAVIKFNITYRGK